MFSSHNVIPGRGEAASPEFMNTGLWKMDSGFGPLAARATLAPVGAARLRRARAAPE